ncbi:MAG TPA: NAD(P)H-dependent oxidoreductase [Pilimelia sp.]|nr:NAD(P)H-dependent oxidoreductase [Pilimelia sp.]
MTTLQIIVASTRPGRIGLPIGQWCLARAERHGGFDVSLVDLAAWDLPLMDEPAHPRLRQYTKPHTQRWSAQVEAGDAFVLVMPEYNFGYTAPLKNALDYLYGEWADKPVGLVSYGGVSGGLRATQLIRPVLQAVRLVCVPESVTVPHAGSHVADGVFAPVEATERAMEAMLTSLADWADLLRARRAAAGTRAG